LPFGFMVTGAAIWPRPQKTDDHDLPGANLSNCFDHCTRAFDMDFPEGLLGKLTIDAGAMNYRFTFGKGLGQLVLILKRQRNETGSWTCAGAEVGSVQSARDQHDFVAFVREQPSDIPANKTRSTGDGN